MRSINAGPAPANRAHRRSPGRFRVVVCVWGRRGCGGAGEQSENVMICARIVPTSLSVLETVTRSAAAAWCVSARRIRAPGPMHAGCPQASATAHCGLLWALECRGNVNLQIVFAPAGICKCDWWAGAGGRTGAFRRAREVCGSAWLGGLLGGTLVCVCVREYWCTFCWATNNVWVR